MKAVLQVALALFGFAIGPALWGTQWAALPEGMRMTILAGQLFLMASGFVLGWVAGRTKAGD